MRKAPGADRITGRMLHELPDNGILWLTHIMNAVLGLSTFPTTWKGAKVIMVPKQETAHTPVIHTYILSISSK